MIDNADIKGILIYVSKTNRKGFEMETKTEPKLQIRYCNINKLFYLYGITDKKEIEMATFKSLVAARKEAYQPLEEMSSYKKLTLDDKLSLIGL